MKYLSVIIPSYNSEAFIINCLNSFDKKNIDDLEIIVINDGSKDKTSELVHEYIKDHPYIKIVDKENGGHGSGFNKGLEVATGLYLKILDSDDFLDQDALRHLLDVIKKHMEENHLPDVYLADHYACVQDTDQRDLVSLSKRAKRIEDFITFDDVKHLSVTDFLMVHMTFMKVSFLKENKINLLEKVFYEDSELVFKILKYAREIYFLDRPIYLYTVGRAGQSISLPNIDKNYLHQFKVMRRVIDSISIEDFKALPKGNQYHIKHELTLLYTLTYFYAFIIPNEDKTKAFKELVKHLKENNRGIYKLMKWHTSSFFLFIAPPFMRHFIAKTGYKIAKRKEGWK